MTLNNHIKDTITLSVPLVIGQLGHMMMSITDNVMVGKVGSVPLAAASVSNTLFYLVMIVGIGISYAITPLTAIAHGGGNDKECGVILRQGLLVNMVAAIVLLALTMLLAHAIRYLNQPDDIIPSATVYLKTLGLSIIPVMVFQSYKQFAEGVSVIKAAMVITLLANIVNVFVNWVCIYGNLGVKPMGLTGAGVATFCSRTFMAVCMVVVVVSSSKLKRFDPTLNYRKIDFGIMKKLLGIGLPAGMQYLFEVSAFAGATIIVGWIGTKELAAHQIALNLASVSYMVAMGISSAATVRVGTAVGGNDIGRTRLAGYSAFVMCGILMCGFALIYILLRNDLPSLYVNEKDVIGIASTILVIVAFFQISDGTQTVGLGVLRGLTDMKIPTMITFAAYWVLGLPVGYYLGISCNMGVVGVWTGILVSLTFAAVTMVLRFHYRSGSIINS